MMDISLGALKGVKIEQIMIDSPDLGIYPILSISGKSLEGEEVKIRCFPNKKLEVSDFTTISEGA